MVEAEQFRAWLVCQVCGRVAPDDDSIGWLNRPHPGRWDIKVIRCPQHWSDLAVAASP